MSADNALGFVDEMFLIDADGTNLTQITNTEGGAYGAGRPVWSPDGSQIAFTRFRDLDPAPTVSNVDTELLVVNSDGTGQMIVADTHGDDHSPVWSPDGTRIAFHHSTQSTTKIMLVNADGTGQRALARTRGQEWGPRWSPDGTLIAFTGVPHRHGVPSVHIVGADGSDQTTVGLGANPRWSPDGSRIAFVDYGDTGSTWEIVSINPDGTDPTPLSRTGPETIPTGLVWSPDRKLHRLRQQPRRRRRDLRGERGRDRPDATDPQRLLRRHGPGMDTRIGSVLITGTGWRDRYRAAPRVRFPKSVASSGRPPPGASRLLPR